MKFQRIHNPTECAVRPADFKPLTGLCKFALVCVRVCVMPIRSLVNKLKPIGFSADVVRSSIFIIAQYESVDPSGDLSSCGSISFRLKCSMPATIFISRRRVIQHLFDTPIRNLSDLTPYLLTPVSNQKKTDTDQYHCQLIPGLLMTAQSPH